MFTALIRLFRPEEPDNYALSRKYRKRRKRLERFFKISGEIIHEENFDDYKLVIKKHYTRLNCSSVTRGLVYKGDRVIADIKRNYAAFPYTFIRHSNGNKYLVCGEDYQGYTVVNLTLEKTYNYVPKEAEKGAGFCWVQHKYFEGENDTLEVEGCYWAFPYEVVTYDFNDPDTLPYKELSRREAEEEDDRDEESCPECDGDGEYLSGQDQRKETC